MKRRTYNNMVKATQLIADKGYMWYLANELAIQCFNQIETSKNGMPVEWFIDKISEAN